MFGQTLAGLSDVFIWTAGPLLSEVWFPSRERATATAIGTAISVQVSCNKIVCLIYISVHVVPLIIDNRLSTKVVTASSFGRAHSTLLKVISICSLVFCLVWG